VKLRRPGHATVVAYAALFVALGGTAWAALHIGSKQVVNNSLRSSDLRNGKAVGGKDVIPNSLGRRQVDEASLNPSGFIALGGSQPQGECALSATQTVCASTQIALHRRSQILAVASGGEYGNAAPNTAACELHLDDNASIFSSSTNPGEENLNTSPVGTNGFGLTGVTHGSVPPGKHTIALVCGTANTGTAIHAASVAALAIAER
jgi:hypothetical protein